MPPLFPNEAFLRRWAVRIGIVWLLVLYGRTAFVSREEHRAGVAAEEAGDVYLALAHHRRALRHAAPPFDSTGESLEALLRIGSTARSRGDVALELAALRSARGSLLASRFLLERRAETRARIDQDIARAVASFDRGPGFRDLDQSEIERAHRRELEEAPAERPYGVALASLSFLAFVYFAHRLLTENVSIDDRWDEKTARRTLLRMAVSFVLFVVGLFVA